jgi:hypothetical protein
MIFGYFRAIPAGLKSTSRDCICWGPQTGLFSRFLLWSPVLCWRGVGRIVFEGDDQGRVTVAGICQRGSRCSATTDV